MTDGFDKDYWESHWRQAGERGPDRKVPPSPYLVDETSGLVPGTALDAGCGEGAEALWLARNGWTVTAADISTEALARAGVRATEAGLRDRVRWVEADLSTWEPETRFDLVATHYAHPAIPQLAFYERLADWVSPGGTLLIVGHRHTGSQGHAQGHAQGHGHGDRQPPDAASVTAASITAGLDPAGWTVRTAREQARVMAGGSGGPVDLNDVVVSAVRHPT